MTWLPLTFSKVACPGIDNLWLYTLLGYVETQEWGQVDFPKVTQGGVAAAECLMQGMASVYPTLLQVTRTHPALCSYTPL